MKTRMEQWKSYRDEIEMNIELKKAVHLSNEKLHVLYGRLLKVYPDYEKKFPEVKKESSITLQKIKEIPHIDDSSTKDLIEKINSLENHFGGSLSTIDDINFSSQELDEVIKQIKKGKIKNKEYVSIDDSSNVSFKKNKKTILGGYHEKN